MDAINLFWFSNKQVIFSWFVPLLQNDVRNYVLEVEFPENLTTNYGKTLPFSQEMQGTAEHRRFTPAWQIPEAYPRIVE